MRKMAKMNECESERREEVERNCKRVRTESGCGEHMHDREAKEMGWKVWWGMGIRWEM